MHILVRVFILIKNKQTKSIEFVCLFCYILFNEGVKMMLSEELIELANQTMHLKAETQTLEVNAVHEGCPKKLYDTLSSFSNQDGIYSGRARWRIHLFS